jgi:hypothetical protein
MNQTQTKTKRNKNKKSFKIFFFLIVAQPEGLRNITALRADVFLFVFDSRPFRVSRTSGDMNPLIPRALSGTHESNTNIVAKLVTNRVASQRGS